MKKTIFTLTMLFALLLTACSGGTTESATTSAASVGALNTNYDNALPIQLQLSVGTFELEGSDLAVDSAQAAALLPLWQVLNGMNESGTAAQEEVDALVAQIAETMTAEQIEAIAAMQLTREDMSAVVQEYGLMNNMMGGSTPPEGFTPGMGRNSGVPGLSGGGPGADSGMSPEQIATAQAERQASGESGGMMNSRVAGVLADGLIELLQSK